MFKQLVTKNIILTLFSELFDICYRAALRYNYYIVDFHTLTENNYTSHFHTLTANKYTSHLLMSTQNTNYTPNTTNNITQVRCTHHTKHNSTKIRKQICKQDFNFILYYEKQIRFLIEIVHCKYQRQLQKETSKQNKTRVLNKNTDNG